MTSKNCSYFSAYMFSHKLTVVPLLFILGFFPSWFKYCCRLAGTEARYSKLVA